MPGPDARTLLRKVAIFAHLDDAAIGGLARLAEAREFPAGAVIVGQDDPGEALYVLARGRVKVVLYGESGREIILSLFREPGDFFGEMSLLDDQPRSATVIALETSTLLILKRGDFHQHLEGQPRTALAVLAELSRRLRRADEVIGNLALLDVYGRVARLLLDMAENVDGEKIVTKRLPKQDIAKMIGASREMVSRVMKDLQMQGLIEEGDGKIVLHDRIHAA